jgi:hypothetical protein
MSGNRFSDEFSTFVMKNLRSSPMRALWAPLCRPKVARTEELVRVDLFRVRALRKASREYESQALASDAVHFANDMLGTVAVLAGLLVVLLSRSVTLPDWLVSRADAFAATIVAQFGKISSLTNRRRSAAFGVLRARKAVADKTVAMSGHCYEITATTPDPADDLIGGFTVSEFRFDRNTRRGEAGPD